MTTLDKLSVLTSHEETNRMLMKAYNETGFVIIASVDDDGLPMAYTVGLTEKFNHEELLLLGIESTSAVKIINSIVSDIAIGFSINYKTIYSGLLGKNYLCLFTPANVGKLPVVTAIYGTTDVALMIAADSDNSLPGLDADVKIEDLDFNYYALKEYLVKELTDDCFVDEIEDVMFIKYDRRDCLVEMQMKIVPYEGSYNGL